MSASAHAKPSAPPQQAAPQVDKQEEQELTPSPTQSFGDPGGEDPPADGAAPGGGDVPTQLSQAATFGHSFAQIATSSTAPPAIAPKRWQVSMLGGLSEMALNTPSVQAKLSIGQPGDKYEQEADQMAARVMAMPDSAVQREPEEGDEKEMVQARSLVQREPVEEEGDEEETLQARSLVQREPVEEEAEMVQRLPDVQAMEGAPEVPSNFEGQLAAHRGGGKRLDDGTRAFMEPRFGEDFSGVRIHETPDLAGSIQAQAFTHGQDIYFNAGKYRPGSSGGRELLAHELTHVVQQTNTIQREPENSSSEMSFTLGEVLSFDVQQKLSKLKNISKKVRQRRVKSLIQDLRDMINFYPSMVSAYKNQNLPSTDEKVRVIGRLVVEAAKMEHLIGTIYVGGSEKKHKWTSGGANAGYMPNYYQEQVGMRKGENITPKEAHWCSAFTTTLRKNVLNAQTAWKGYGIANNFDFDGSQGGNFSGINQGEASQPEKDKESNSPWRQLAFELREIWNSHGMGPPQAKTLNDDRFQKVDQFIRQKKIFVPQAGDIMVVRRVGKKAKGNSFHKRFSHTTTIEKVVFSRRHKQLKVYTIEGNKRSRVMGRMFDLTDPKHVDQVIFIGRPSLSNIRDVDREVDDNTYEHVTESDLLDPIRAINQVIRDHASVEGYIGSGSENSTTYELGKYKVNANE